MIHVIELKGKDADTMLALVVAFDTDRQAENAAKKNKEANKEAIRLALVDKRNLDVDTLPEKDTVIVKCNGKGGIEVKRKGSERLDTKGLRAANPTIAEQFTIRTVASYFEPLN